MPAIARAFFVLYTVLNVYRVQNMSTETELSHQEVFNASTVLQTEVRLTLNPNGSTITVQNFTGGAWVNVSEAYSTDQLLDVTLKSGTNWRLDMADSGAAAKAHLS